MPTPRRVGILTAGGDSPGLNAAIRGVGKAAIGTYGMEVVGFRDGFRGLVEDKRVRLDKRTLSGILTIGGTILGTSRDKPHKMLVDGEIRDMTDGDRGDLPEGGPGRPRLPGRRRHAEERPAPGEGGLNVITLPKTIDNDVAMTDATFGFDTALEIATEAIDRLHSTAHSHHRIIVAEVMGHRAGWLTLGAGLAGGADVILIPEIPYRVASIAAAIKRRNRRGTNFSIVAVAEGARKCRGREGARGRGGTIGPGQGPRRATRRRTPRSRSSRRSTSATRLRLAHQLEQLTGLESRVSILGYIQRGGTPSPVDRLLATRLGSAAADLMQAGTFGVMVAARGDGTQAVPLEEVAGKRRAVPLDGDWVATARHVGTCLGD